MTSESSLGTLRRGKSSSTLGSDDASRLLEVLRASAAGNGKSFIRYGEQPELRRAILQKELVVKQKDLLSKLKEIKENMIFTEKQYPTP